MSTGPQRTPGETLRLLIRLGRLKFLPYSFLSQGLGAACAVKTGASFKLDVFFVAQLVIWSSHLMTHYCNEYFDYEADRRNESGNRWTGGSRVLVEGLLPRAMAMKAMLVLLGISLTIQALAACLWPEFLAALPVASAGLLLGIFYSAPPIRLHSHGLGELTVAFVVASLTPLYGFVLQHGQLSAIVNQGRELALILTVFATLQYARMILMNLPDRTADASVGKRTLVVILGPRRAIIAYVMLLGLAYLTLVLVLRSWIPWQVVLGFLLPAPLGMVVGWKLLRGAWTTPERLRLIPLYGTLHVIFTTLGITVGEWVSLL
jgi:1,4-dihydroxy-2-naphthoate octaprenyltransferase